MKHLACIMDGNRRWARKQGIVPWRGHRAGVEVTKRVIDFCIDHAISHLSLYAFSIENLSRSAYETQPLFQMLAKEAPAMLDLCVARNVHVRFVGDDDLYPAAIAKIRTTLEEGTRSCDGLQLHILFCYGAQQEILSGVRRIVQQVQSGQLRDQDISAEVLEKNLWMASTPPPDLILRTGGAHRLSNFLLYQAAYSEIHFLDCLWPELQRSDLEKVLESFRSQRRSFGT